MCKSLKSTENCNFLKFCYAKKIKQSTVLTTIEEQQNLTPLWISICCIIVCLTAISFLIKRKLK